MTGKELERVISGCKRGSSECFGRLVDTYSKRVYGYFYRLTGNKDVSDELLSEIFVKLVTKIGSYKGGSFDGWLFKIASNIFYDYLREKQNRAKLLEARKNELESRPTHSKQSDLEQIDRLQIQLDKLDADTKNLILLRYYSQLSFKEIAAMRSEPIGTTLSKIHRGLKKLRELMG